MSDSEIRALYWEFIGYLREAPVIKTPTDGTGNDSIWKRYNSVVEELGKITGKDYTRFLISPKQTAGGNPFMPLIVYRQALGGIISKLYAEYFNNELYPLAGGPDMVITQTQQQNQSVTILLEVQGKIDEKLSKFEEDSKEHSFLKKLRSALPTISSVTQLLTTVGKIASDLGITAETITSIFS